jgi:SNARE protein
VQVGSETAQQLKAQTEQLGRIYDELYDIDDMLDRSTVLIKKMLKTAGTDKCVWVFAFLLVCGIIATIIVTKVGPKNALADQVKT